MIDIKELTTEKIQVKLAEIAKQDFQFLSEKEAYQLVMNCIDLTTLEGSDTKERVVELCKKASGYQNQNSEVPNTAAVCVYPVFAKLAKSSLQGKGLKVACVAGAFPAGQSPIHVKVAEVKYAVEQGADEIDMVISRGSFLEGDFQKVSDEIKAIKAACGSAQLKVILETGELQTPENIYKASQIAIEAGADFIKTSTGKVAVNATPEAMYVMLLAIKEEFDKTGKKIGIKPAGGIADAQGSIIFIKLVEQILGREWLNNTLLRFGASRLADKIADKILNKNESSSDTSAY